MRTLTNLEGFLPLNKDFLQSEGLKGEVKNTLKILLYLAKFENKILFLIVVNLTSP